MTQEEKREAIRKQLAETPEKSDRQIASEMCVDKNTVNKQRKLLETTGEIHQLATNIGADGKERPRQSERKPISILNPTPREEKAIQNPVRVESLQA